jgi:hypothetical protein
MPLTNMRRFYFLALLILAPNILGLRSRPLKFLYDWAFDDSPLFKKKSYTVGGLAFFWLFGNSLQSLCPRQ